MALKTTLLAPLAPFRGGIARHSTALGHAIAARGDCDLTIESFDRLYPRRLYPGASDRDSSLAIPTFCETVGALDTLDPLSWRAAVKRITGRETELVAIPAWTFFVAPMLGTIARSLRRQGIEVVQMVHNAADHDGAKWKDLLSRWQIASADRYVVHGEAIARALGEQERKPVAVCPHPAYCDYPAARGDLPREAALELLCFGLMRPYKGIDLAIEALAASGRRDVRLTIAGEAWQDIAALQALVNRLGIASQVEFRARYVSDAETAELFGRADIVLAPYREVTGSGVVALAQHYRRPVIASALPGLIEHVREGDTGWLFPAGNSAALSAILRDKANRIAAAAMAPAIGRHVDGGGWNTLAAAVVGRPV